MATTILEFNWKNSSDKIYLEGDTSGDSVVTVSSDPNEELDRSGVLTISSLYVPTQKIEITLNQSGKRESFNIGTETLLTKDNQEFLTIK